MVLEKIIQNPIFAIGTSSIIALGAGAYIGYCDSQGTPINSKVNSLFKFGPTLFSAFMGGYFGLIESISDEENTQHAPLVLKRGLSGAIIGAIGTGLGYSIGYSIGSINK